MMRSKPFELRFARVIAAAFVALLSLSFTSSTLAQKCLHDGFKVELLFETPDIEHPSVVACDDKGNLFIGEDPMDMRGPATKEFDRILYVTFNADGSVKKKTVFAENLSAVFGMIWHDGALYVMHAPHYTMFKDTDGDGVADVRKELADGFGPPAGIYGFNDHIVTGTHLGMDGFVYVSVGDKGIQRATSLIDKSEITLEGGGVVRMKLDGTQLENFTSGTRNHLDTAMNSLDDIFTYDNTDDGRGWWTRFTHHVPTGYYGYPYDYHPHPDRHLPRIAEFGGGSPVGADGYREAAWPAKYHDAIFYCEWGKRKVQLFTLKKNGATYDATMEDFLVPEGRGEFRPLDLTFSPDGKHMYLADWNFGGWRKSTVAGRVFRITYVGEDAPKVPASPFEKGADDAGKLTVGKLVDTLKHPAHSQRMLAQWELIKRGRDAIEPTGDLLKMKSAPTIARIHAAWVLYHLSAAGNNYDATEDLVYALHNGPDDLRAQAARAIGTGRLTDEKSRVLKGLIQRAKNDTDASVRMHAAVALGRIGDPAAAGELFLSLDDADTFARFTKVQALRAINSWDLAPAYTNASESRIREGAILALTGQYDDGAVKALAFAVKASPYPELRAKAVEAIAEVHRKSEPYVKGWWGTQPARGKPARPKRIEWSGTQLVLDTLVGALKDSEPAVRLAAIRAQQEIGDAGALDSLRSLVRTEKDSDVRGAAMQALAAMKDTKSAPVFAEMIGDTTLPHAAREEALRASMALGAKSAADPIVNLVKDDKTPAPLMALAVEALGELQVNTSAAIVAYRMTHEDKNVRIKAIEALGTLDDKASAKRIADMLKDKEADVRRAALRTLAELKVAETVPAIIEVAREDSMKREAAAALAAMPDRRALPVLLEYLTEKNGDVRKDAGAALAALRDQIIDDLIALQKANELRADVRRELGALYATPKPIFQWQMLGAWAKEGPQPKVDVTAAPNLKDAVTLDNRKLRWKKITTKNPQGMFNPGDFVKPDSDNWALAYAEVKVDAAGSYAWSLGSDDQAIVWINGKKVFEFDGNRGYDADSNHGTVTLSAGVNHIYFQTGNSGGPWQFSFALGGADPRLAFLNKDVPPQLDLAAYRNHAAKNKGDASRGKQIFFDANGVGCVKCHAVGKEGTATVGPNLLQIGAKYPREELIRSVLEPSNRIFSGYEQTLIETDDGERYSGIIKRETDDELELIDANAKSITLKKKAILERRGSTLSMMPNGLEKGLSLQDFADIVAYLESQK